MLPSKIFRISHNSNLLSTRKAGVHYSFGFINERDAVHIQRCISPSTCKPTLLKNDVAKIPKSSDLFEFRGICKVDAMSTEDYLCMPFTKNIGIATVLSIVDEKPDAFFVSVLTTDPYTSTDAFAKNLK